METTRTKHEQVTVGSDVGALDFEDGEVLLIDKPMDWTSFDIVRRVRSLFGVKKVGHAGTLDPKATGLLIVCTGRRTKDIQRYTAEEKEYEGIMQLGSTTASFDSETPQTEQLDYSFVTEEKIREVFQGFVGRQLQTPPMYSALKYGGRPLYKYARKGRTVVREPREVTIEYFELLAVHFPDVHFRVVCSKETYVRSLISECGRALGCGAFLKELRRTRIGQMSLRDALQIQDLHSLGEQYDAMRNA